MSKLDTVLSESYFWSQTPEILDEITKNYTRDTFSYYYTQNRSLQQTLRGINNYYNTINPYKLLIGLCSTILNGKIFKIHTKYRSISSTEAEQINLNTILADLPTTTGEIAITFYHIPKGKSYLRKYLDESTTPLKRIAPIEHLCTTSTTHFVRIYQGLENTGPESITVFSDQFTTQLIQTIIIMLPNILNLNPITKETLLTAGFQENQIEHAQINGMPYLLYNERVQALRNIFEYLYELQKAQHPIDHEERTVIKTTLSVLLANYVSKFNWKNANTDTFTQNLAKAKNRVHQVYYTQEYNEAKNIIKSLEHDLTQAYERKTKAERELLLDTSSNCTEDVAPFMETIKNTSAIEVLTATEQSMLIKITAPLQFFTSTDFEAYERNPNSEYNMRYALAPIKKQILHKIFVTREYQLIIQGIIKIEIEDSNYTTNVLRYTVNSALERYDQFPNPHLYHHNCWSRAKQEMEKNICEGNYELVVMQMVAAVQTINIAERASFVSGLLNDLNNIAYTEKITILDKAKKKYTWNEILKHEEELQNAETRATAEKALNEAKENNTGYTQIVISEEEITENELAEITTDTGDNDLYDEEDEN